MRTMLAMLTLATATYAGNCNTPSVGLRLTTTYAGTCAPPAPAPAPVQLSAAMYGDCGGGGAVALTVQMPTSYGYVAGGAYASGYGYAVGGFRTVNAGYGYGVDGGFRTVSYGAPVGVTRVRLVEGGGDRFFGVQAGRLRIGFSKAR